MSDTTQALVRRLATIQAALGLSNQDFAQVLGISRQELFTFLGATESMNLHEAGRKRLAVVERIGRHWRKRSATPMACVVNEPLGGGLTALSMMVAEVIDEAAIMGELDGLVARAKGRPRSRSQKLADAGFTRRPSARALPTDE